MFAVIQVLGSLLVLAAFVAAQLGRIDSSSTAYLVINAAGSAVLTVTAVVAREWGFILLEGVWALVSLYGLVRQHRGTAPASH